MAYEGDRPSGPSEQSNDKEKYCGKRCGNEYGNREQGGLLMSQAKRSAQEWNERRFNDKVVRSAQKIGNYKEENVGRDCDGGEEYEKNVGNFGLLVHREQVRVDLWALLFLAL